MDQIKTSSEKFSKKFVNYHSYIQSSEWKLKREEIIKRAKGICERCHNAWIGDIHHLTYKNLGNELLEDLLGLCKPCHMFVSGKGPDPLLKPKKKIFQYEIIDPIQRELRKAYKYLPPDIYQQGFRQAPSKYADFGFWYHIPPCNVPEDLKEKWIDMKQLKDSW